MAEKTRPTVYSTDPAPEPAHTKPTPTGNLAAAIPTRQLNTPVRVWLDRKGRGGKTVSLIKGIMSPPAGKEALVKLLKNKLGTGGAVKDGDIEIQGDHREKIVALLNELGYKAKSAGDNQEVVTVDGLSYCRLLSTPLPRQSRLPTHANLRPIPRL